MDGIVGIVSGKKGTKAVTIVIPFQRYISKPFCPYRYILVLKVYILIPK